MTYQIVPLTSDPNQTFQIALTVDGRKLTLKIHLRYNEMAGYWVMSIANPSTGILYIDSLPLVSGDYPAHNLLGQYAYLGIGSAYLYNAGNVAADRPDDTNLGTDWLLLWGDTP